MKPSSSPSEGGLFDGVLARGAVRDQVGDTAWLQAMLDAEAALAYAGAEVGLIGRDQAGTIAAFCRVDRYDLGELGRDAAAGGNPVIPLVRALTAAVYEADPEAAKHVHRGATSQDILDTAAMLVAYRALEPMLADLTATAETAARLADEHRATLMPGRTLLQHALPITFGLTAAGWLVALDTNAGRLSDVRDDRLAVQLGGASGTLASLAGSGVEVVAAYADVLGLAEPVLPWHTDRTRVAELAGALGTVAGAVAKIGRDVALLAQTEVAEVREEAPGGSSTMPHKRNPVSAVSAVAAAQRAPGLVSTLLGAMAQEHQRGAGSWHTEWLPLRDLLGTVGSAVASLRDCLGGLVVDADRMRANLDLTGGHLLTERVTTALTTRLGRLAAHDTVTRASAESLASGRPLGEVLAESGIPADEVAALLDPASYLGSADEFIDRALAAHESTVEEES
ncbi:MAG: 3-carboxy-cis,cis-muconate cycloisomerase [Cryptosporangiaceae bacterium]|nr:3-carboxy-cis,cis-muconate cycloisomerase [Cryptosporangiaceae bacterium]